MPPSLPTLATDLAAMAVDALDAAGLTVAGPPVLYHGPIPDEAECVDGRVAVWWESITGTDRFPTPTAIARCGGGNLVALHVRWTRCWPIEPNYVEAHSAIAAELADGAWLVHNLFAAETCARSASLPEVAGGGFALTSTTHRAPMGGVAGVQWKLLVRPYLAPDALSTDGS